MSSEEHSGDVKKGKAGQENREPSEQSTEFAGSEESTGGSESQEALKGKPSSVGQRISELAERGEQLLKSTAEKVEHLAEELSETARLKLELRRLEGELNHNYRQLGREVWEALKRGETPPLQNEKVTALVSLLSELSDLLAAKKESLARAEKNPGEEKPGS